jgi:hypothetical protein
VDSVPDPLLLRKSGSSGNQTQYLWICCQELWPLDHRGGLTLLLLLLLIWLYSHLLYLSCFFSFLILYTVSTTPWMRDQPAARPLPTLRTINAHNTDIHALSRIRTHDLSVRVSKDSSCLRPRGHCDRHLSNILVRKSFSTSLKIWWQLETISSKQ